jgi:hypothetical protein
LVTAEYNDRPVAATSGFNEVTELGYLLSRSAGLVIGDEYELAILDSVGGIRFGRNCGRF